MKTDSIGRVIGLIRDGDSVTYFYFFFASLRPTNRFGEVVAISNTRCPPVGFGEPCTISPKYLLRSDFAVAALTIRNFPCGRSPITAFAAARASRRVTPPADLTVLADAAKAFIAPRGEAVELIRNIHSSLTTVEAKHSRPGASTATTIDPKARSAV
jgi:hypothetical protein